MGMITPDFILKAAVLVALAFVRLYWYNAESEANLKRPPSITKRTRFRRQFMVIELSFYALMVLQFFVPFLTFTPTALTRIFSVVLFGCGVWISIEGRRTLGLNWNHMIDYQVKERQALVTEGIYKYVRHPIYAGFLLMLTGIQVALHSWMFLPVFIIVLTVIYLQSKREEAVLARHFGKEYLRYLQSSKMFFPFIF